MTTIIPAATLDYSDKTVVSYSSFFTAAFGADASMVTSWSISESSKLVGTNGQNVNFGDTLGNPTVDFTFTYTLQGSSDVLTAHTLVTIHDTDAPIVLNAAPTLEESHVYSYGEYANMIFGPTAVNVHNLTITETTKLVGTNGQSVNVGSVTGDQHFQSTLAYDDQYGVHHTGIVIDNTIHDASAAGAPTAPTVASDVTVNDKTDTSSADFGALLFTSTAGQVKSYVLNEGSTLVGTTNNGVNVGDADGDQTILVTLSSYTTYDNVVHTDGRQFNLHVFDTDMAKVLSSVVVNDNHLYAKDDAELLMDIFGADAGKVSNIVSITEASKDMSFNGQTFNAGNVSGDSTFAADVDYISNGHERVMHTMITLHDTLL